MAVPRAQCRVEVFGDSVKCYNSIAERARLSDVRLLRQLPVHIHTTPNLRTQILHKCVQLLLMLAVHGNDQPTTYHHEGTTVKEMCSPTHTQSRAGKGWVVNATPLWPNVTNRPILDNT
jgi:hypothetical protein